MSDNTYDNDEPRDVWEIGLSVPAISFAEHRVGEGFSNGIIIPVQKAGKYHGLGYEIVKKTKDEEIDGKKTGRQIVDRWPDGKSKGQTVLALLTDLPTDGTFDSFMSTNAIDRFKTAAASGDQELLDFIAKVKQYGLRRAFITGGSLDPEFKDAVRKSGDGKPQPCAYVSIRIAKMEANEHPGGKTKFYKVEYRPADDASRARVAAYLAAGAVVETGKADSEDPWRGERQPATAGATAAASAAPAATSGDEPPF